MEHFEKSKVLIVGCTGYIGRLMTRASLKLGHPTYLLIRPEIVHDIKRVEIIMDFKSQGAKFIEGSINDHDRLVAACKEVDVVVSAMAEDRLLTQLKLVAAIKEAGNIKRFLPSEFGLDPDRLEHAMKPGNLIFEAKRTIRRAVEAAGIPYTIICANLFAGYFLAGLAQFQVFMPPRDKVQIYGHGNHKVVWVVEEDIGLYSLSTVDDPRAKNKIVYIRPAGNILSMNEVVAEWEKLSNLTLEKSYLSEEDFVAAIPGASFLDATALSIFYHCFYTGEVCNFDIELEATAMYPDIKYTSASKYLARFL